MLKRFVFGLILVVMSCSAFAGAEMLGCEPVVPHGEFPIDYNNVTKRNYFLPPIERAHFPRQVEMLVHGSTTTLPMGDIDYMLTISPNHPRVLQSLVRLSMREKSAYPQGAQKSVDCYFKRAMEFAPHDVTPRMLLAQYLASQGKSDAALKLLLETELMAPEDANLAYNIGLLQMELKHYDQALAYAHKAYQVGFPLPGLREKLKRAGQWREPAPKAAEVTATTDGKPAPAEVTTTTPVAPPAKSEAAPSVVSPAEAAIPVKP